MNLRQQVPKREMHGDFRSLPHPLVTSVTATMHQRPYRRCPNSYAVVHARVPNGRTPARARSSFPRVVSTLLRKNPPPSNGNDANIIQVEIDCSGIKTEQDHFHKVDLPTGRWARAATGRATLKNCGYDIPPTQISINLARADIEKEGSELDLPMALGIVGARGGLTKNRDLGLSKGRKWRK